VTQLNKPFSVKDFDISSFYRNQIILFEFEINRMALSVAVPIRLAISSLVREIFMNPSGSVPNFCSSKTKFLPVFHVQFSEREMLLYLQIRPIHKQFSEALL
jgi:hypothetical protein